MFLYKTPLLLQSTLWCCISGTVRMEQCFGMLLLGCYRNTRKVTAAPIPHLKAGMFVEPCSDSVGLAFLSK